MKDATRTGSGTGSAANRPVRGVGGRIDNERLTIRGFPRSEATAEPARQVRIPTAPPESARRLDVTIDGSDDVDPEPSFPKGGVALPGGKVFATVSERMVVIADVSKPVRHLGGSPLPVEILTFASLTTRALVEGTLAELGIPAGEVTPGIFGGSPFITGDGKNILDLRLKLADDSQRLDQETDGLPDVIGNGQFGGMFGHGGHRSR